MTRVPRELWQIVSRLATAGGEWPPRNDSDVAAFFGHAIREDLLPLLMADPDVPEPIAAAKPGYRAMDALYRRRFELNREATHELQRILGPGAFVFLKGCDYRHRLYDRPELRPMVDIDVLAAADEIPAMIEKLACAGYPRKYSGRRDVFVPEYHEVSFEMKGAHVEIHRSFAQGVRAGIDYRSLWQRREWFERDGIGGYRLSASDALLCHAFHLAKDEFSSNLCRFVDFYLLLQRYEERLGECVERAQAWGIERPLFGALHVVSGLFSGARTPIVRESADRLLNGPTRRFLVARVLPEPAAEPSGHVTGRSVQLWRKYWLIDRSWRKFAFLATYVYETLLGAAYEWRARRNGLVIPTRRKA